MWQSIGLAVVVAALSSPYLASLAVSVLDRTDTTWWHWKPQQAHCIAGCAAIAVPSAALAARAAGWTAAWPAFLLLGCLGAVLVVTDLHAQRMPDRILVPLGVGGLALLALADAIDGNWEAALRALSAGSLSAAAALILVLCWPRSLGLADAKLVGVLGAYLGSGRSAESPDLTPIAAGPPDRPTTPATAKTVAEAQAPRRSNHRSLVPSSKSLPRIFSGIGTGRGQLRRRSACAAFWCKPCATPKSLPLRARNE